MRDNKIKFIVRMFMLDKRSRAHEYYYPRLVLISYLRMNTNKTLKEIGGFFSQKHDTMINALSAYEDLVSTDNKDFLYHTNNIRKFVNGESLDLQEDVMNIKTSSQLKIIKNRIKNNLYEKQEEIN